MKRILTLSLLVVFALFLYGCNKTTTSKTETTVKKDPVEISIPDVVVDLFDPENKVEVNEFLESKVKDSSGRELTKEEWLLNSKFSKDYILSLGLGEYTFKYESSESYGNIKLIIKDELSPNYCFNKVINEIVYYDEYKTLPLLVKNQDSYQDDFEPTYSLYRKGDSGLTEVEYVINDEESFKSDDLSGDMVWRASVTKDEKNFDFDWNFHVESKEEYRERVFPNAFITKETKRFVTYTDEGFILDSTSLGPNYDDFLYFKVDPEIIDNAKSAGFSLMRITLYRPDGDDTFGFNNSTDNPDIGLWIYDKWKETIVPCAFNQDSYIRDNLHCTKEVTVERITYTVDFHINGIKASGEECFLNTGLTFQFAYQLQCELHLDIEFGEWNHE